MIVIRGAAGEAQKSTNAAGAVVSETLLNIRTVAAYGLERAARDNFAQLLVAPMKQFHKKGLVTGLAMGASQCIILSGAGLAYYAGGEMFAAGSSRSKIS